MDGEHGCDDVFVHVLFVVVGNMEGPEGSHGAHSATRETETSL